MARLTRSGRRVAIIDPGRLLHPPGLRGVLLDNLLIVRPGINRVLWTIEQLARCDAIPLTVVIDPPGFSRSARRIQRAADAGQNLSDGTAREIVYGMDYADWKAKFQTEATATQKAQYEETHNKH